MWSESAACIYIMTIMQKLDYVGSVKYRTHPSGRKGHRCFGYFVAALSLPGNLELLSEILNGTFSAIVEDRRHDFHKDRVLIWLVVLEPGLYKSKVRSEL